MNTENDKLDCFARVNESVCNALSTKECKNCSFYKNKKDVPNYSTYLKKGKKELLDNNSSNNSK